MVRVVFGIEEHFWTVEWGLQEMCTVMRLCNRVFVCQFPMVSNVFHEVCCLLKCVAVSERE